VSFKGKILLHLALVLASATAFAKPTTKCGIDLEKLKRNPLVIQMTLEVGDKNQWIFPEPARKYFKEQRALLQKNVRKITKNYAEVEHFTRRTILGLMLGKHLFAFGDPGGTKSELLMQFINVKVPKPDPEDPTKTIYALDRFLLQFDQFTSDTQLKGYVDPTTGE